MAQLVRPAQRHFYLYAKGHYRRGALMADVRRLVADYVGSYPQHVTDGDVLRVVWEIVYPEIERLPNRSTRLLEILTKLLAHERPTAADTIALLLSVLTVVRVKEGDQVLLDLGEPDENILPLSKSEMT